MPPAPRRPRAARRRFHLATLGCPKNAVDSEKIVATLVRDGLEPTDQPGEADLVVVNTCAFVEAAREESVETILALADVKRDDARLVVTGCMAERYGEELAAALPEADAVVGFAGQAGLGVASDGPGVVAALLPVPRRRPVGVTDLLDLPRPAPAHPWAYLKVAEGCDRRCAFCAIPSFRGRQVSRSPEAIVSEGRALVERGAVELVLVAQDIARYGRDANRDANDRVASLPELLWELDALHGEGLRRQRLLYLYPSEVHGELVDAVLETVTGVPYFDLSLQHASAPLLERMRRWGSGDRFLEIVRTIRERRPDATFRSSFIVGFPGETEGDHDALLSFLDAVRLDWAGFFPFSREDGTPAASMDGAPDAGLVAERIGELDELQEAITRSKRHELLGRPVEVLVDAHETRDGTSVALGRTHREAPEIDGVVEVHRGGGRRGPLPTPGSLVWARVTAVAGVDLEAELLGDGAAGGGGARSAPSTAAVGPT